MEDDGRVRVVHSVLIGPGRSDEFCRILEMLAPTVHQLTEAYPGGSWEPMSTLDRPVLLMCSQLDREIAARNSVGVTEGGYVGTYAIRSTFFEYIKPKKMVFRWLGLSSGM